MPANTSRRGFFGFLAGAAALPIVAKLPAAEAYAFREVSYGYSVSLSEIVTMTLRARSGLVANSLMTRNALLAHLERTGAQKPIAT